MRTGTRLIGVVTALVVMLGSAAVPAQAAPSAPVGKDRVMATPAPAGFAPVAGPTYHFSDATRANGDFSVMAATLPFNYTFTYEKSMESRRFKTTTGKVCNWTDVYSTQDIRISLMIDVFGSDPQQGDTIWFSAAGGTHYYCWTGVNNNNTYYLVFGDGVGAGRWQRHR